MDIIDTLEPAEDVTFYVIDRWV